MSKILPNTIDNNYQGRKIALWFFYLITIMTVARSLMHMFIHDGGAQSIGTIPLDTFGGTGAEAIISIFALWGLSQLLIAMFYVLVVCKYRSLIPLMYIGLFIEYAGRWAIANLYKPLETLGQAPGGTGNYIIAPLAIIMFFLSINEAKKS